MRERTHVHANLFKQCKISDGSLVLHELESRAVECACAVHAVMSRYGGAEWRGMARYGAVCRVDSRRGTRACSRASELATVKHWLEEHIDLQFQ